MSQQQSRGNLLQNDAVAWGWAGRAAASASHEFVVIQFVIVPQDLTLDLGGVHPARSEDCRGWQVSREGGLVSREGCCWSAAAGAGQAGAADAADAAASKLQVFSLQKKTSMFCSRAKGVSNAGERGVDAPGDKVLHAARH